MYKTDFLQEILVKCLYPAVSVRKLKTELEYNNTSFLHTNIFKKILKQYTFILSLKTNPKIYFKPISTTPFHK